MKLEYETHKFIWSQVYTYILWNHPYAIIIMIAEVAVVGWLMGHRKIGMVLADTLYWMPLGYAR